VLWVIASPCLYPTSYLPFGAMDQNRMIPRVQNVDQSAADDFFINLNERLLMFKEILGISSCIYSMRIQTIAVNGFTYLVALNLVVDLSNILFLQELF
jgi:hypothetical protein